MDIRKDNGYTGMKIEKKDIGKLAVVFVLILLVGLIADIRQNFATDKHIITRNELGQDATEKELEFIIEGIESEYDYVLEVEAVRPTREQASDYFRLAEEEIDSQMEVFAAGTDRTRLPLEETYANGMVEAEWTVSPWDVVKTDGTIRYDRMEEPGCLVHLSAKLYCGAYERIYSFAMELPYPKKQESELIMDHIRQWVAEEMAKEGESVLQLPTSILGREITWKTKQSNLTGSLLLLELIAVLALVVATRKKAEQERKRQNQRIGMDYPDVVGQLTLLLGAGMNSRQAWNIIATRYFDNRQKRIVAEKPVFEGVLRMNRRIQEGENEKTAYQELARELQNKNVYRLMQLLIGNLEKGAKDLCRVLETESRQAYEERILLAKRLGEEASTRMLIPLMLMMIVVMAIVMAPAMIDFMG